MALLLSGSSNDWPPWKDSRIFLCRARQLQTTAAAGTAAFLACAMQASAASASLAGYTLAADMGASDLLYNIANKMDALVQQQLQGMTSYDQGDRKQLST